MNKSVNNIINALGGTTKLANLLGVNPSAVSNYRQKGFPARLHLKIIALCEEFSIPIDNDFIDKSKIPLKVIKSNSNEFLTHKSNSIMSSLSSDGYQLIDPPILVPADKVIDRLGETIVDRLYIFSQKDGVRLCLRPDLTIPTCLYYLDQGLGGEKKLYSYFGKVFQFYDEEENEPTEFTQTGIESIGDQDSLHADVDVFVKIYNALKKEGINNFKTYFGDVSLIQEFINVLDIPDLWKKSLLEKFWNEEEFKVLLNEISKKNIKNDKFVERVYSLDIDSALELVRGTINSSDGSFFAGRSLEEITDRLRKKGESYVQRKYVVKNEDWIDKYKVLTLRSYGAGGNPPHYVTGKPLIASPGEVCTETYLVCGVFDKLNEAEDFAKYLKTKFVRFLVYLNTLTQT